MVIIGIDASLRSTGITVSDYNPQTGNFSNDRFFIITPHTTKSQSQNTDIKYIEYHKTENKTETINNYIDVLQTLLFAYEPEIVIVEDIPYLSGSRSVVDLAILNGAIRTLSHMNNIDIYAVNNMTWKKELIGNGGADKDFTVMNFVGLNPSFSKYTTKQINDVADSFFICRYYWKIAEH